MILPELDTLTYRLPTKCAIILGRTKLLSRLAEVGDISGEDNEMGSLRWATVGGFLRVRFSRIILLNLILLLVLLVLGLPPLLLLLLGDAVGLMVSLVGLPLLVKLDFGLVQLATSNETKGETLKLGTSNGSTNTRRKKRVAATK